MKTDNTVDRMRQVMELSRKIGAPIDGIPKKAVDLVNFMEPYLRANANPKEAVLIVAAVYLYFAAILMRPPKDGDIEAAMDDAKLGLDTAHLVMSYVSVDEDC